MGTALVRGLCAAGWDPAGIVVAEVDDARRDQLAAEVPGVVVDRAPRPAAGALLAVKPAAAEEAARALRGAGVPRWLSIMAGVPIASLESWAGPGVAVVRAMPNTPALVGAGVAALAGGSAAGEADLAWAEELLGAVGETVRVAEDDLDAVTGVSGSGPAYVFLLTEALADAGVSAGLAPAVAARLAALTVAGAGRLLADTGEEPAVLRAQVTSPGGTTEAALRVLEEAGLRTTVTAAVAAATTRSRELGGRS